MKTKNLKKTKSLKKSNSIKKTTPLKVGVVTARFNHEITEKLEEGALHFLEQVPNILIEAVRVPGAVEIPLACKALFERGCEGVVALGAVIRGDTSHYDVVCNSVERGVTQLMLEKGKPIGFGVLTTENEEQALDRAGGIHGNKGVDAAQVTLEMMGLLKDLREIKNMKMENS
ncbi:MAG TPA: 6,7-dimethyl-8-ribityllumazine synthase [Pseudobdellovibrionaceae bacterium]|nr:6,7-dimethyl-8-ribityllumazine synthase [Pseudobdellovibrionaceae bacterium]